MLCGQDCEGIVSSGHQDPSSDCKLAILSYVRSVQEDLSRQLDAFEQQIVGECLTYWLIHV